MIIFIIYHLTQSKTEANTYLWSHKKETMHICCRYMTFFMHVVGKSLVHIKKYHCMCQALLFSICMNEFSQAKNTQSVYTVSFSNHTETTGKWTSYKCKTRVKSTLFKSFGRFVSPGTSSSAEYNWIMYGNTCIHVCSGRVGSRWAPW